MFKFTGKSVVVDYETGYLFQIEYLENNQLRWTSLKERTDGAPMTGIETYSYQEVAEDVYFFNWIEAGGLVVSQTLNFKSNVVVAFMSWEQEGERGNRGHLFHQGTIMFKD